MRKLLVILGLISSVVVNAQQYIDTPYLQDYAIKFNLMNTVKDAHVKQVRSDRNMAIKVLSGNGLLNAYNNELSTDMQYRPLTDMNIIAFDDYQNQFVYLTDTAVLSNAWGGTYEVEHGLANPSQFAMGSDFTTLVTCLLYTSPSPRD